MVASPLYLFIYKMNLHLHFCHLHTFYICFSPIMIIFSLLSPHFNLFPFFLGVKDEWCQWLKIEVTYIKQFSATTLSNKKVIYNLLT